MSLLAQSDAATIGVVLALVTGMFGLLSVLLKWLTGKFDAILKTLTDAVNANTAQSAATQIHLAELSAATKKNTDGLTEHGRISSKEQKEIVHTVKEAELEMVAALTEVVKDSAQEGLRQMLERIAEPKEQ